MKTPTPTEPIDLHALLAACAGDRAIVNEVLIVFLKQVDVQRAAVHQAFDASDLPLLKRTAHKLKGSLLTLFATEAAGLAADLECADTLKSPADLEATVLQVIECAQRLLNKP